MIMVFTSQILYPPNSGSQGGTRSYVKLSRTVRNIWNNMFYIQTYDLTIIALIKCKLKFKTYTIWNGTQKIVELY